MDKIIIRDLLARGIIGVHDWERQQAQDILINIVVYVDLHRAGETDDIKDSVDYDMLSTRVLAHVESAQRWSLEALASDIAQICLEESRVRRVWVRVEKPNAVRFARSVGVEIERGRED